MKIGYLGPEATFTNIATKQLFPEATLIPYAPIPNCLEALEKKEVDAIVVPIENALEGTVNLTIDYLFHRTNAMIQGETTLPIQQHLMVHKEHAQNWTKAKRVLSHPHALPQCHQFLHQHFTHATLESVQSTAYAAQYVSEHPEELIAAIANEQAAEKYGLSIVQENVHDYPYNHTRFIVLAHEPINIQLPVKENKSTIMATLPMDRAGALHQLLSTFAWRQINLTKIESRPLKTGLGNYFFMIDIEDTMENKLVQHALEEIEALGFVIKVLGSYHTY